MVDISLLVAQNLKKIRDEKKLSLEKLAEMTGVSKSMLGQIERGESQPDDFCSLEDRKWTKDLLHLTPQRSPGRNPHHP